MEVKTLEVRDRMAFIPALAIRLEARDNADLFLLKRAGFSAEQILFTAQRDPYILLSNLISGETNHDPYAWRNARTMPNVHKFLIKNWNDIVNGSVIDVEFVLAEAKEPKTSEAQR